VGEIVVNNRSDGGRRRNGEVGRELLFWRERSTLDTHWFKRKGNKTALFFLSHFLMERQTMKERLTHVQYYLSLFFEDGNRRRRKT
jgi:hypothetical protein